MDILLNWDGEQIMIVFCVIILALMGVDIIIKNILKQDLKEEMGRVGFLCICVIFMIIIYFSM